MSSTATTPSAIICPALLSDVNWQWAILWFLFWQANIPGPNARPFRFNYSRHISKALEQISPLLWDTLDDIPLILSAKFFENNTVQYRRQNVQKRPQTRTLILNRRIRLRTGFCWIASDTGAQEKVNVKVKSAVTLTSISCQPHEVVSYRMEAAPLSHPVRRGMTSHLFWQKRWAEEAWQDYKNQNVITTATWPYVLPYSLTMTHIKWHDSFASRRIWEEIQRVPDKTPHCQRGAY